MYFRIHLFPQSVFKIEETKWGGGGNAAEKKVFVQTQVLDGLFNVQVCTHIAGNYLFAF